MLKISDKKSLILNLIYTGLFAVITIFFVIRHEIWADEAQAWLIVQNLGFIDLFKHLVNEGHPSLFYLLIMPFAKLKFSIFFMQILCWLSTCFGVFLLWQFAPFQKTTKLAITLSAGFLYFFPVIARSYSLLPLLLFLTATLYQDKNKHPIFYSILLVLIANTHVIMFCFAFLLGLFFVIENIKEKKQKVFLPATIIFMGLTAVVLQLWGTENSNSMINFSTQDIFRSAIVVPIQFFVNAVDFNNSILFEIQKLPFANIAYFLYVFVFLILYINLCIGLWGYDKKIFALNSFSVIFQLFIYVFAYSALMYPSRIFCAFLITIFCWWIALDKSKKENKKTKLFSTKVVNALIAIFFAMSCFNGINYAYKDFVGNYSSAKETAEFIQKNIPENAILIPTEDGCSLGIYYYLPSRKFWSIRRKTFIKYMKWVKEDNDVYEDYYFTKILEYNVQKYNLKNVYILSSDFMNLHYFKEKIPSKYELIFSSSKALSLGESFKVYKFKG